MEDNQSQQDKSSAQIPASDGCPVDTFNLSDKLIDTYDFGLGEYMIDIEDVRQFIKLLNGWKDIMKTWHIKLPTIGLLCSEFDRFKSKLAGRRLTDA